MTDPSTPSPPRRPGQHPKSQQTIFPRTHQRRTPLTKAELAAAREQEKQRKKWDKFYITAEQARTIPHEAADRDQTLQERVRYSQPDWPENKMSATEALGPLKGGEGEQTESRSIPAEDLFTGRKVGDGAD
jgi:hypothetical protein